MCTNYTEWLQTNGLGGYASGTLEEYRSRKYHGLLCTARHAPTQREMLVNGVELVLQLPDCELFLTRQQYADTLTTLPNVVQVTFKESPWPTWQYTIENFGLVQKEIIIPQDAETCIIKLSIETLRQDWRLTTRPLLSGRSHHNVCSTKEPWQEEQCKENIVWKKREYTVHCQAENLHYNSEPTFYENFAYEEEKIRGYEYIEHCYSPGKFTMQQSDTSYVYFSAKEIVQTAESQIQQQKIYKDQFSSTLEAAADQFIVKRKFADTQQLAAYNSYTIIAGYPWFTDWGRDTFIAMRGLLLNTKRFNEAESILLYWANQVQNGLLPNRFIDDTNLPEYNSVDAPLWFIIVCYEFLQCSVPIDRYTQKLLQSTCVDIIENYSNGTDYNITMCKDGLLYCGRDGMQLTWMDAKYNNQVITPRIGKPVEINSLWLNALQIVSQWNKKYDDYYTTAQASFIKFWNPSLHCLHDVLCVNGDENKVDSAIRCNQLLAIGGLPFAVVNKEQAIQALKVIETHLYTPMGIRSLSPFDQAYVGEYSGTQLKRDSAYHQGTIWPYWIGPYVDAYMHAHEQSTATKNTVEQQIVTPLLKHFNEYGMHGICEVANGSAPHVPNGCPWQAWSLGELLRVCKKYNFASIESKD